MQFTFKFPLLIPCILSEYRKNSQIPDLCRRLFSV